MRLMAAIGFALLLSVSGFAQTVTYEEHGRSVLDSAGNLFIIDSGRSTTGVTISGLRRTFFPPKTRITVQRPGTSGNTQTVEFDGSVEVIGVGTTAVYAIATVYTVSGTTLTTAQSLIAIRSALPAGPAFSGFPSLTLNSPVEARVGLPDYISLITFSASSSTATSRTAQVVHFNGASFSDVISSGTLP